MEKYEAIQKLQTQHHMLTSPELAGEIAAAFGVDLPEFFVRRFQAGHDRIAIGPYCEELGCIDAHKHLCGHFYAVDPVEVAEFIASSQNGFRPFKKGLAARMWTACDSLLANIEGK